MTKSDLFLQLTEQFQKAGCDSPAFDACCLLEDLAGVPHGADPRYCSEEATKEQTKAVLSAAVRRAKGEPLQYILGEWDFLSLTLSVGKGVLIPRPDTEILCETAAQKLKALSSPKVLDLCAGTGCVGLGVASLLSSAEVTAVERSDEALVFLTENVRRYARYKVSVVQDDVLAPKHTYGEYDAILSNPPYIPTADLDGLMREVQHEPRIALDGSEDGLLFYRQIISYWIRYIRGGGWLLVEVGIGQAADVKEMMERAGLTEISIIADFGGVDRVVCGRVIKS